MKILIIGSSGFIGKNILDYLIKIKTKQKVLATFNSNIIKKKSKIKILILLN